MKIFLSGVSEQFRECREALKSDFQAAGAEVVEQEDFQQHGRTLLEKLESYIAACDHVIALVGTAYGWEPPAGAFPGYPRRSYSQWEYFFAQGERLDGTRHAAKDIHVYVSGPEFRREHPVAEPDDVVALHEIDPQHRPLFASFAADAIAAGRSIEQWDRKELLASVLRMETSRWQRSGVTEEEKNLLAVATMTGGFPVTILKTPPFAHRCRHREPPHSNGASRRQTSSRHSKSRPTRGSATRSSRTCGTRHSSRFRRSWPLFAIVPQCRRST